MSLIELVEQKHLKENLPEFAPGDTVRVHVKVIEGDRQRVQSFEGTVIGRKGRGTNANFTVRRVTHGVGVERTFPLHSPNVEKIEVRRRGQVRRAKLYYLRQRVGKATKVKEASRKTTPSA